MKYMCIDVDFDFANATEQKINKLIEVSRLKAPINDFGFFKI